MSPQPSFPSAAVALAAALALLLGGASVTAQTYHPPQGPDRIHTDRAAGKQLLKLPKEEDAFGFVVFGDRTGGPASGIAVLRQAVADTNLLDPDLVLTVGDLVEGYNAGDAWKKQAAEYRSAMAKLRMPWYPVAGNHDIYWRGPGRPKGEHEGDYEATFGPLWYAVEHKKCWFVVLYSDEGDPATGKKDFNDPACQKMSKEQFAWLQATLAKAKQRKARHVFLFLHHPRWIKTKNHGDDWDRVHALLKDTGIVTAVFGGHIHRMRYDPKDGIQYFTVASVGAELGMDAPQAGYLHQFHVVTVRPEGIQVAALPVGAVIDPKSITGELSDDVTALHGKLRPEVASFEPAGSDRPALGADGAVDAVLTLRFHNPARRAIELELVPLDGSGWQFAPDHQHLVVAAGKTGETTFAVRRAAAPEEPFALPRLEVRCDWLGPDVRVAVPRRTHDLELPPPADLAAAAQARAGAAEGVLVLDGREACVELPSRALALPDGPFTLEAWIRGTSFSGRRALLAKTENSEFGLYASDGRLSFLAFLGDSYRTAAARDPETKGGEPDLRSGVWHHVAGVFDGAELRAYVDGKLVGRAKGRGARKANELPLFLGADPDGRGRPGSFFHGAIDEVRISTVARYTGDAFAPVRRHEPDTDTAWLLRCEPSPLPWLADHSPRGAHGRRRGAAHCTVEPNGGTR